MQKEVSFNLAEFNRNRTTEKVILALKSLTRSKKEITFDLVSKIAGISRKTLYNREDLMTMVKEIQSLQQDKKIHNLNQRNRPFKKKELLHFGKKI